jgi:hypothetical protein
VKIKQFQKYGSKLLLKTAVFAVILVGIFTFVWVRLVISGVDLFVFFSAIVFIGGTVMLNRWYKNRLVDFHCPKCGMRIDTPTISAPEFGDPINYYCPICETVWVTGLISPNNRMR